MRVIDLTHTINENMPVYPGTDTPKLTTANTYEKNGFKETYILIPEHIWIRLCTFMRGKRLWMSFT